MSAVDPRSDECPHGEPYGPGWACPPCQDATQPQPVPAPPVAIEARYDSWLSCGHTVREGDPIVLGTDGWICTSCGGGEAA